VVINGDIKKTKKVFFFEVAKLNNDYDIKKIFEDIELELIKSMKRTLWSHQQDEEAKNFKWRSMASIKNKTI
jgi:hypothetical protein